MDYKELPNPVKVQPFTVAQVNFREKDLTEERSSDIENFQQSHFQQHFQQPMPIPQQLPPAPRQLPTLNYQQQMQMEHYRYQNQPQFIPYQNQQYQPSIQQFPQHNQWIQGPPQPQSIPGPQFSHLQAPWTQPPLPEFLDPRESIDLKLIRKTKKKDKRCYTCKPRGKVKNHVINTSSSGLFTFHHDMHKRPVIIITPVEHVEQIQELGSESQLDLFKSVGEFCELWNINDYQITINVGRWQTENHPHLHCKIKIPEKMANRMRRDHFEKLKMEKRYENKDTKILGPKPTS